MKKQTAVEWLVDELKKFGTHIPKLWFKEAKEIEKQQFIDAYNTGYTSGREDIYLTAEQYHNQTFTN